MSAKLRPKIMYGTAGKDLYPFQSGRAIEWLCFPLTAASRKEIIEAMAQAMAEGIYATGGDGGALKHAQAALAALELMAKTGGAL